MANFKSLRDRPLAFLLNVKQILLAIKVILTINYSSLWKNKGRGSLKCHEFGISKSVAVVFSLQAILNLKGKGTPMTNEIL